MWRRELIVGSGVLLAGAPAAAQSVSSPAIGVLLTTPRSNTRTELDTFVDEVAARGWTGARAPRLTIASAEDDLARLRGLANLLVATTPTVLVAQFSNAAVALATETATVPVVVVNGSDFASLGLSDSLARPSRNVTGFSAFDDVLEAKRLDILLQAAPSARRIGVIWHPGSVRGRAARAEVEAAATSRGVAVTPLDAGSDAEMLTVFDRAAAAGVEGLVVISGPVVGSNIDYIVERSTALRLPAVYGYATFGRRHGGLLTYAPDPLANWRGAAGYVDRLLRGARVSDLPIQQPERVALTVHLGAARKMGLALPPSLLAAADEVIE